MRGPVPLLSDTYLVGIPRRARRRQAPHRFRVDAVGHGSLSLPTSAAASPYAGRIKRLFAKRLAAACALVVPPMAAAAGELDALRNRARPVIILSDAPGDARARSQHAALDAEAAAVRERDITVLAEDGRGALHRRLGVAGFAVVLVGKDGDVKHIWREPVEPRRIFAVIDAMPMRRQEMRR